MKKYLFLTSALVVLSGTAEAACIQTPSCSSLGYESTSSCSGGLKCPFGNAWNCTIIDKITEITNKITTIEEKITVIEENGGSSSTPDYSNCKIGSILYSDMSCNENVVYTKEPIGVVFDEVNHLAVALEEKENVAWSTTAFDIPGLDLHPNDYEYDGWGKKNTRVIYEYCKANGKSCPAVEYAYEYTTAGTSAGDWHLPSYVEMAAVKSKRGTLNKALQKLNKTVINGSGQVSSCRSENNYYWTSTVYDKSKAFHSYAAQDKTTHNYKDSEDATWADCTWFYTYIYISRPVIAF